MSEERRKLDRDHDLLVEIHTIVTDMKLTVGKHIEEDKKDFEKVHKRINGLYWKAAAGSGIVAALAFFKGKIFP